MPHIHKWSEWAETHFSATRKIRYRLCLKCGRSQVRDAK